MISVLVLTFNEELHIKRCIESINRYYDILDDIVVVDSYSNDTTLEILDNLPVSVYENKWLGYSSQLNWALKNCKFKNNWLLRIDADEEIFSLDMSGLIRLLSCTSSSTGIVINIHRAFLGKRLKFGGTKIKLVRLVPLSGVEVSDSAMDEKFVCERILFTDSIELIDNPRIGVDDWLKKHIAYSSLECQQIGLLSDNGKKQFYYRMPLFLRCFMYFIFRYFILLGFLDGTKGFLWHFYQAFWYRIVVDTKLLQLRKTYGNGTIRG